MLAVRSENQEWVSKHLTQERGTAGLSVAGIGEPRWAGAAPREVCGLVCDSFWAFKIRPSRRSAVCPVSRYAQQPALLMEQIRAIFLFQVWFDRQRSDGVHICCRGNGSRAIALKIQFTPQHAVIYHRATETDVTK